MQIKQLHPNFKMPTKGTAGAGAFDIYMPTAGSTGDRDTHRVGLGFSAAVPEGYIALLLPRSGAGAKFGLELNNTCGVIDSDYRGEWLAVLKTKSDIPFSWSVGDRVLQFLMVPVFNATLKLVSELDVTDRGAGGFGSSGQ